MSRERILEVASRLFAQNGFRRTTTRDIAVAAQVNQTTLFRHFKEGKHQLALEAIDHVAEQAEFISHLNRAFHGCDPNQPESIQVLVQVLLQMMYEHNNLVRMIWYAIIEEDQLTLAVRTKYIGPAREFLQTFCKVSLQQGCIRHTSDEGAFRALIGAIFYQYVIFYILGIGKGPDMKSQALEITNIWLYGVVANNKPE